MEKSLGSEWRKNENREKKRKQQQIFITIVEARTLHVYQRCTHQKAGWVEEGGRKVQSKSHSQRDSQVDEAGASDGIV